MHFRVHRTLGTIPCLPLSKTTPWICHWPPTRAKRPTRTLLWRHNPYFFRMVRYCVEWIWRMICKSLYSIRTSCYRAEGELLAMTKLQSPIRRRIIFIYLTNLNSIFNIGPSCVSQNTSAWVAFASTVTFCIIRGAENNSAIHFQMEPNKRKPHLMQIKKTKVRTCGPSQSRKKKQITTSRSVRTANDESSSSFPINERFQTRKFTGRKLRSRTFK